MEVIPHLSQPGTRGSRRIALTGALAFILVVTAGRGEFGPRAYRVDNFGENLGTVNSPTSRSPDGEWVVNTRQGIVWQTDATWRIVPPPPGIVPVWASSHPRGLIAAGRDSCWLYTGDAWTRLPFDDAYVAALRLGGVVLVQGKRGLHSIDAAGAIHLLPYDRPEAPAAPLRLIAGRALVARPTLGLLLAWDDGRFASEPLPEDWATLPAEQAVFIADGNRDGSGYFFAGGGPVPRRSYPDLDSDAFAGLAAHWREIRPQIMNRPAVRRGDLVWFQTAEGIAAWSASTGERRWTMTHAQFGGRANLLVACPDGLLVGTDSGLQLVPDPDYYSVSPLPPGKLSGLQPTPRGAVLNTSSGDYYIDGRKAELGAASRGLVTAADGSLITVEGRTVHWRSRALALPWLSTERAYMLEVTPDLLAFLDETGCRLVDSSGRTTEVKLPGIGAVMANQIHGGNLLVSTTAGIAIVDHAGRVTRTFGSGGTTVIGDDTISLATDRDGRIYDDNGRELMRVPLVKVIGYARWRDRDYVEGRLADGSGDAVLELDFKAGTWRPLDIPVPSGPLAFFAQDDALVLLNENRIVRVQAQRYLDAPPARVRMTGGDRLALPAGGLPAAGGDVVLQFPSPRLGPWSSPRYRFKVGDEPWQSVPAGAVRTISRLAWGRTPIQIEARQAGLASSASLEIQRARPWWVDWPGGVLYAGGLAGFAFGIVRWRTAVLRARNRHLEETVAVRTEELRQANAVKSEFILAMNHEVRNPINGIVGLTQMLSDRTAGPRDRMLLDSLQACTAQLRATLDDVLDFSAIERGSLVPVAEDFNLGALLWVAAAPTGGDPPAIRLTEAPPGSRWFRGDAGKIRLVLGNFIGNALKYGLPPRAELSCTLEEDRDAVKVMAVFRVRSPGPPLSAEECGNLFQPFVRGSRARQTRAAGTGLGLVMCRRYAQALGGDVGVEADTGGNTFWLRAPLRPIEAPAAAGVRAEGIRALAVEDESYNRLVLGHYLGNLGCVVDWAATAREAVDLVRRNSYQVIFTDCSLPDAAGAEVLHRLRAAGGAELPPIIVISASATTRMREEVLLSGARVFLGKPIDPARLQAVLADLNLRPAEVAPPPEAAAGAGPGPLDFSRLLLLGPADRVLAGYADELTTGLAAADAGFARDARAAAASLHQLRNALLLVRAANAADLLAVMENLIGTAPESAQIRVLWQEARAEVLTVVAAAREAASLQST